MDRKSKGGVEIRPVWYPIPRNSLEEEIVKAGRSDTVITVTTGSDVVRKIIRKREMRNDREANSPVSSSRLSLWVTANFLAVI